MAMKTMARTCVWTLSPVGQLTGPYRHGLLGSIAEDDHNFVAKFIIIVS